MSIHSRPAKPSAYSECFDDVTQKRPRTIIFALSICTLSFTLLSCTVTRQYDLAREFAELIKVQENFKLAIEPDSNIVCFRYQPAGLTGEELSRLNRKIRKKMFRNGTFYLVQTKLNDGLYLRVTLMNAFTNIDHLTAMLTEVKRIGIVISNKND